MYSVMNSLALGNMVRILNSGDLLQIVTRLQLRSCFGVSVSAVLV